MNSLSAEAQNKVKACKTTEELQAFIEAEGIDIMKFTDSEDRELSLDDLEGVEGGKGLIAGTLAAALAAITFASCGGVDDVKLPSGSAHANISQAVTTVVTEQPTSVTPVPAPQIVDENSAEESKDIAVTAEKAQKTEKTDKKETKKKSKKNEKKTEKKETKKTEPAQTTVQQAQPAVKQSVVLPTTYAPVIVDGDVYAGKYTCRNDSRGVIDIANIGNNYYSVHISWWSNTNEANTWDFIGQFDGRANLNYNSCIKNNHVYGANGADAISTIYTNGTGSIRMENGNIVWNDNMGDIVANTVFDSNKPQPAPAKQEVKKEEPKKETAPARVVILRETPSKGVVSSEAPRQGGHLEPVVEEEPVIEVERDEYANYAGGSYFADNGVRITAEIHKSDRNDNSYEITIYASESAAAHAEYHFYAHRDGNTLTYSNGYKQRIVFDEDGNVVEDTVVSQGHSGTIELYTAGFAWNDIDGSSFTFTVKC